MGISDLSFRCQAWALARVSIIAAKQLSLSFVDAHFSFNTAVSQTVVIVEISSVTATIP